MRIRVMSCQSCQHHCVEEDFTLDDLCLTWWWVIVVVSSSPPSGWTQQSSAMQSSPTSMGSLSRRLLELWVGKSFPFLDTFPQMKTAEAVINNCWVIVNMSGFLFLFFHIPPPQHPLSPCCVSLLTVKGRNTLMADLFPTDRQRISD